MSDGAWVLRRARASKPQPEWQPSWIPWPGLGEDQGRPDKKAAAYGQPPRPSTHADAPGTDVRVHHRFVARQRLRLRLRLRLPLPLPLPLRRRAAVAPWIGAQARIQKLGSGERSRPEQCTSSLATLPPSSRRPSKTPSSSQSHLTSSLHPPPWILSPPQNSASCRTAWRRSR